MKKKKAKSIIVNDIEYFDPQDKSKRLPYETDQPLFVLQALNVRFPFRQVIDKNTCGCSTCPVCGAKHRGFRYRCDERQVFWCVPDVTGKQYSTYIQFKNRKEAETLAQECDKIVTRKTCECVGECTWDLQEEFAEQVLFFNALDSLALV